MGTVKMTIDDNDTRMILKSEHGRYNEPKPKRTLKPIVIGRQHDKDE